MESQRAEHQRRIEGDDEVWKLSPMDLDSYSRWYDYSRARDDMFAATHTEFAPWYVADANHKKRVRLNVNRSHCGGPGCSRARLGPRR